MRLADGKTVTAHCANPGSMMGVAPPGAPVWLSKSASKTRKLPYSLELIAVDGGLVAINTQNPNKIAAEAINRGAIPELSGYQTLRREVKYGASSRIDILLDGGPKAARAGPVYVEIKNVHLRRTGDLAEFPDSVTARGAKHLEELITVKQNGARAVMLYIVQRGDCRRFAPADDLDPAYAEALRRAAASGVELIAYDCEISLSEVTLRKPLTIDLDISCDAS